MTGNLHALVSRFRSPAHWNADGIGTLSLYSQWPAYPLRSSRKATNFAGRTLACRRKPGERGVKQPELRRHAAELIAEEARARRSGKVGRTRPIVCERFEGEDECGAESRHFGKRRFGCGIGHSVEAVQEPLQRCRRQHRGGEPFGVRADLAGRALNRRLKICGIEPRLSMRRLEEGRRRGRKSQGCS